MPGLFLLGGLGLFILLLDRGFQPQIFGYIFVAAITWLLGSKTKYKSSLDVIYIGIVLSIGIAASWWLLLPIVYGLMLVKLFMDGTLKAFLFSLKRNIIPKLLVVFSILYPIVVNTLWSKKIRPLDEPGAVDKLSWSIFFYLAPVVVIALITRIHKMRRALFIDLGLVFSIVLALIIGLYQKMTVGHYEYYFYKSIYTVLIFSIAIAFICTIEIFAYLDSKFKYVRGPIVIVSLIATLLIAHATKVVNAQVYVHD